MFIPLKITDAEWRRRAKVIIREFDAILRSVRSVVPPEGHYLQPPSETLFTLDVTSLHSVDRGASIIFRKPGADRADLDQTYVDVRLFWPHLTRPCGDKKTDHYAIIYGEVGQRLFAGKSEGIFVEGGTQRRSQELYAATSEQLAKAILVALNGGFLTATARMQAWSTSPENGEGRIYPLSNTDGGLIDSAKAQAA